VRKCRSLLATQLRGVDLCRFQGSVCRPDEGQAEAKCEDSPLPVFISKQETRLKNVNARKFSTGPQIIIVLFVVVVFNLENGL